MHVMVRCLMLLLESMDIGTGIVGVLHLTVRDVSLQQITSSSCYNLLVVCAGWVGLNWTDPMRWDAFGGEI